MANKSSNEITETLLEAMDTVILARIAQLPYDKTIVCTIIDDSQAGIGKYKVTADNGINIFTAYADSDIEYYKDTQVYVKILNNDAGVSRLITGKYIPKIDSSTSRKSSNGIFYLADKTDINELNYSDIFECSALTAGQKIQVIPTNNIFGYNGMKITFNYSKRNLDIRNNARLKVKISLEGTSSLQDVNLPTGIAYETDGEDYLPVNNLLNNDNNFSVINSLFLSFGNQNLDITKINIEPIFENINTQGNDYGFTINNVKIEFGYWIKELGPFNDALFILPADGTSQYYNDNTRTNQNFIFRYIQIDNNNIAKIINLLSSDIVIKDKIYWGYYDSSFRTEDTENSWATKNVAFWHPLKINEDKSATITDNLNTSIEKIKIKLTFKYINSENLLEAQDFYLYNDSYSSKTGSITKGIEANFEDNTNGNYFIYDKDGMLLNNIDSSIWRKITLRYVNRANPNDILKANEKFILDNEVSNNSMIEAGELKENDGDWYYLYKIKNNYNQNYNNNILQFSLIHNGTKYTIEKELLFGYSGSEENGYNIRVNLVKDNQIVDKVVGSSFNGYKLDAKVYDYNNKPIDYECTISYIPSQNQPDMAIIRADDYKAKIYYPFSYSSNEDYHYNGPMVVTYDEKGTVKFNKQPCSLTGIENVQWTAENNSLFTLDNQGNFMPAKFCYFTENNNEYIYKVITTTNNEWRQTIIFQRNQNITSTQIDSTLSSTLCENTDDEIEVTNLAVGRRQQNDNSLFLGSAQKDDIEEFGLFNYYDKEQIFKATDSSGLRIGSIKDNNLLNGDSVLSDNAILKGAWTVTNANKLISITQTDENEKIISPLNLDDRYLIKISEGLPQQSDLSCGASNQPIYINEGEIIAFNETIGNLNQPIYIDNGIITALTEKIGSNNQPVYINDGIITPINEITINGNNYSLNEAINKLVNAINKIASSDPSIWDEE